MKIVIPLLCMQSWCTMFIFSVLFPFSFIWKKKCILRCCCCCCCLSRYRENGSFTCFPISFTIFLAFIIPLHFHPIVNIDTVRPYTVFSFTDIHLGKWLRSQMKELKRDRERVHFINGIWAVLTIV